MEFRYPTRREAFVNRLRYLSRNIRFMNAEMDSSSSEARRSQDNACKYSMVWVRTMQEAQEWEADDLMQILKEETDLAQEVRQHIGAVRNPEYLRAVERRRQQEIAAVKQKIAAEE
jgi:hypothetical protein